MLGVIMGAWAGSIFSLVTLRMAPAAVLVAALTAITLGYLVIRLSERR